MECPQCNSLIYKEYDISNHSFCIKCSRCDFKTLCYNFDAENFANVCVRVQYLENKLKQVIDKLGGLDYDGK